MKQSNPIPQGMYVPANRFENLIFTAGMSTSMQNFFGNGGLIKSSGATLTVALYVYAKERYKYDNAFSVAVVLLVLTLLINLSATLIGKYFERKNKA